jgi:hypothetical protein
MALFRKIGATLFMLLAISVPTTEGYCDDVFTADKVPGFSGAKRLPSLMDVANQVAVQNEIGLADKTKLDRLTSQRAKAINDALAKAGVHPSALRRMSSEDRIAKANEIFAKISNATRSASAPFDLKLKEVLSAEQFKRLVEIYAQWGEVDALANPAVSDALALSKEQCVSLESIRAELDLALQTHSFSSEERMKLAAEMTNKAIKVLDPDQQGRLSTLRGKPFDGQRFFSEDPVTKHFIELGAKRKEE